MSVPSSPVRPRSRALPLLAALAVWAVGGGLVAPRLLAHLPPESVSARLLASWHGEWWDGVMIVLALAIVAPALAALRSPRARGWIPPATAEGLGAIRVWIAAILLASVLWEDLASSAYLPRGMHQTDRPWLMAVLHALPVGFDRFLASADALQLFESATAVLLVLAMLGLFTRWTVPAAAVAYLLFASILRSYAWFYHTGLVPLYALLLLSFTPCGDGLSLDRWRRARRGEAVPPSRVPRLRYGLGRYLVWMAVALPYTMAGFSKLRNGGPLWWTSEHMKQRITAGVLEPMHFDFEWTFHLLPGPDWVFGVLGAAALAGELFFVLVLVNALARRLFPLVMAGMHVGILLLQNILFPDLIAIQAVFYDWTPLRERVASAWARLRDAVASARLPAPAPALAGNVGGTDGPPWAGVPLLAASPLPAVPPRRAARGTTGAPPPERGRPMRRQLLVAQGFLVVAFLCWATRTEAFPLTAMQMFGRSEPARAVEYVRPLVVYEDGTRERARFERWIGAVADSRYRQLLRDVIRHPEREAPLRAFLDACARRAEALAPPGKRVRRFELEVRRWDFHRHPDDPERGTVLRVLHHTPAPAAGPPAPAA